MNQQLEEVRGQQKQSWNEFSAGWKKWDDLTMDFMKPAGDAIIAAIQPSDDDIILDVAAGTGEPGLTIASMLKAGKCVITDISENMLAITKEHADQRGVTNIETTVCDASELPFDDNSFDAISCRYGFMFFPDMQAAATEMIRVLKPGGKIAVAVWDIPEKNFWVTATMGTATKLMNLPAPSSGIPGMFRCCKPGLMKDIFEKAGFKNIVEKSVTSKLNSGTIDRYWNFITEVGAPIVAALSKADDNIRRLIKEKVYELVAERYPGENIVLDTSSIVISAEK